MKDVPGWKPLDLKAPVKGIGPDGERDEELAAPVYHSKRYVAPQYLFLPEEEGTVEKIPWYNTPL